jgi:hypothetical protein
MKKQTTKKRTQRGQKAALARKLGISPQALNYHLKHPDAPALDDLAGWDSHLAAYARI